MKEYKLYSIFLISICTLLVIAHGFENKEYLGKKFLFEVDHITIYLLLIAIIPFISKYVESIKFGDFEANFKKSSFEDQLFIFLKGVANHGRMTYYDPRAEEKSIGDAFYAFAQRAKDYNYTKFVKMLSEQLKSDNSNQIWFASENIGHFNISELKDDLKEIYRYLDSKISWAPHKLNCLWAYSRFKNYTDLQELYIKTDNINNIDWITNAYIQMAKYYPEERKIVLNNIKEKRKKLDESERNKELPSLNSLRMKLEKSIDIINTLPNNR